MTTPDQEGPDPGLPTPDPAGSRPHTATPEGAPAPGGAPADADEPGPPGFFPVPGPADPALPAPGEERPVPGEGTDGEQGAAAGGVDDAAAGPWQRDVLALRRRQHELDQALRRISDALLLQERRHPDAPGPTAAAGAAIPAELLDLGGRVEELEDAVRSLTVLVGEQQRAANPPMDWTRMRADEARHAWPVLAQWVGEILVPCYELTRGDLPDCWALHPQAVYELSWLRSTHVQAYLPHAHPDVTAQWYTRWRPAALARIRELIPDSRCRPGEHQVTMEESRARRSDTPRPGQAPPATSTDAPVVPPRAQPAVVAHWWANYCMAAHADIAARTDREAREAAHPTDWAPPGLLDPIPDARHPVPDPYRVDP